MLLLNLLGSFRMPFSVLKKKLGVLGMIAAFGSGKPQQIGLLVMLLRWSDPKPRPNLTFLTELLEEGCVTFQNVQFMHC